MIDIVPHKRQVHLFFQRRKKTDISRHILPLLFVRTDIFLNPLKRPCKNKEHMGSVQQKRHPVRLQFDLAALEHRQHLRLHIIMDIDAAFRDRRKQEFVKFIHKDDAFFRICLFSSGRFIQFQQDVFFVPATELAGSQRGHIRKDHRIIDDLPDPAHDLGLAAPGRPDQQHHIRCEFQFRMPQALSMSVHCRTYRHLGIVLSDDIVVQIRLHLRRFLPLALRCTIRCFPQIGAAQTCDASEHVPLPAVH